MSGVIYPEYSSYSLEYINKITEKNIKDGAVALDIKLPNSLSGTVFYTKQPFSSDSVQHLEFYATSDGWDRLTDSGYRSEFFFSDRFYNSNEEIMTLFTELCESKKLDIHKSLEPRQASLF